MPLRQTLRTLTGTCLLGVAAACHRQLPADEHMAHMSMADRSIANVGAPTERALSQAAMNLPASNNAAPARLAASNRHSEWVKIAWEPGSKDSLMAWIVYPTTSRPKTPVVVVVHEIFGLSTWIRSVADQVAAEGFIAIAPDLNSRVRGGPSTVELSRDSAQKLIRGVDAAERNRGIDAAATFAMSQPSADQKYGVIGFCWGGTTVFMHAINGGTKGFSGGVAYYGLPYTTPGAQGSPAVPIADSLKKITQPVMLLSGSKDARIGAAMPALDSMMRALGKKFYSKNYEGAIHGFLRAQDDPTTPPDPATQQANLAATKDAWPKTVAFLKENLRLTP